MTQQDPLAAIDALLQPPGPPERIHGWQRTQMSIARFYGGINYNGHSYTVAVNEPGQPLVRDDVLKREAKVTKQTKQRAKAAQGDLI